MIDEYIHEHEHLIYLVDPSQIEIADLKELGVPFVRWKTKYWGKVSPITLVPKTALQTPPASDPASSPDRCSSESEPESVL